METNSSYLFIELDDLQFDALEIGDKGNKAVLFLHGFPETKECWDEVMFDLSLNGFYCLAYDQRGYSKGARSDDVEFYNPHKIAKDVIEISNVMGIDHFYLVGHDWGGIIAWLAAMEYPDRLDALVAVSTPHPFAYAEAVANPDSNQSQMSSYIGFFQANSDAEEFLLSGDGSNLRALYLDSGFKQNTKFQVELLNFYLQKFSERENLTAALNWYRAMPLIDLSKLRKVDVPTLYLWSTNDIALGELGAKLTEKYCTGYYKFIVLEGKSHWIPEEASADLGENIKAFLSEIDD